MDHYLRQSVSSTTPGPFLDFVLNKEDEHAGQDLFGGIAVKRSQSDSLQVLVTEPGLAVARSP
jgi:hypothetical protein